VIGGYLGEAQGEPKAIADAIRDHYKPVGQGDEVPTALATVAVALADKLDSIGSFFAIGEIPTGSSDPYAVRRAALGALRILIENDIHVELLPILSRINVEGSAAFAKWSSQLSPDEYRKWGTGYFSATRGRAAT